MQARVRDLEERRRARKAAVIDTDVHEMLVSERDLVPYLAEPWRSRVAAVDGWKEPAFPYSYPQVAGVAMADAVMDDGRPAGSDLGVMRRQLLDPYVVERAILVSSFHPTNMKVQPEFAGALASAYNDWLIENWLDKDRRLLGSVTVAAQDPQGAAREIDRVGSDRRFVQVILPAVPHHHFGRSFYHPIFEAAERNGLAVAFHQSNATETAIGLPTYYIEWHTAISQTWQSQLIGLIAHGVFDRFEELRVAMIESSWTWVPHLMWRFDHNYRSLRREVPWVKRMPSEYIRERVRFSTQPMEYPEDPEDLWRMFEMIGSEDFLMFSSDYPHWDFDSPYHVLPGSFPKEIRRRILYDNAKEFYGL
ncbi:MAG: amidohydrolase [Rubrobacteraceae bacterium]|uniref:amidohydrolase family protein n=1 Tax=Rubrobacter calidifluminis TaxID=1392640 RepID=UPI00235F0B3A|nr:amidohydrolase family protein [Rubrobacter calidifluminis]MBX6765040.1 amidohydrolase [Rubrobacteraceae bacterium]